MTFVDLVESLRVECGVSGSPLITVQSLSGEMGRLKKWISDAWYELQTNRQDWSFMLTTFSFTTVAGQSSYTPTQAGVPTLDIWRQNSFWIYETDIGVSNQQKLGVMEWNHFREMYLYNVTALQSQRPIAYAVHPGDKGLWFGPLPDQSYTIQGEAWTLPTRLVADTDTPNMPPQFHSVIVYRAMKKYAGYEAAQEVMLRAQQEGGPIESKLETDQLPQVIIDGGFDGDNW